MIKIGLIDSGIDLNCSAINSSRIQRGLLLDGNHFEDNIGHGTACAYLIQSKAPDSIIYTVKVFDKQLKTSVSNLIKGIKWCIENKIKIINISISTTNIANYYELFDACNEAIKNNVIIVASGNNMGKLAFPSCMENVFGVGIAVNISADHFYYLKDSSIQYYTIGKLNENMAMRFGQKQISSTSFATANMSGIIANILNLNSEISVQDLRILLSQNMLVYNNKNIRFVYDNFELNKITTPIVFDNIIEKYISKLKSAYLLTTNNFEIDIYDRYADYLCFEANTNYSPNVDAVITESCDKGIHSLAKYIFTDGEIKSGISKSNILTPKANFKYLAKKAKEIDPNHIYKNRLPIISLVNLGHYPYIFDLELFMRKMLHKNKIKISQIGSYKFSEFFKCEFSMPRIEDLVDFTIDVFFKFPKILIETINNTSNADCILLGVNYKIANGSEMKFIHNSLLKSIQPDFICFVINDMDSYEDIETKIDFILKYDWDIPFCFIKNKIRIEMINTDTTYGIIAKKSIEKYRLKFDQSIKKQLMLKYKTGVYSIGNKADESLLYNRINKLFFNI